MLIRVECVCGTRFKFDLDDSCQRMPGPVHCPKCNADCTALADANLASQSAPKPAAAPAPSTPVTLSIKGHSAPAASAPPAIILKPAASTAAPSAPPSTPRPMTPTAGAPALRIGGHASAAPAAPTAPPAVTPPPPAVQPPPAGNSLRVGSGHTAPPPVPPSVEASAPQSPVTDAGPVSAAPDPEYACPRHAGQTSVAFCAVCQKRICPVCMESFGYVCSAYCEEQARARKIDVPVFAGQRKAKMENVRKGDMRFIRVAAAGALVLIALLAFFNLYLARPRSAYRVEGNKATPYLASRWANADTVVTMTGGRVAAHKASSGSELWSADVPADAPAAKSAPPKLAPKGKPGLDEDFFSSSDYAPQPAMAIRGSDVWVATPTKAVDYDMATGSKKKEVKWPQPVASLHVGGETITAVAEADRTGTALMRIDPANGSVQTVVIPVNVAELVAERRALAARVGVAFTMPPLAELTPRESGFRLAGTGLAQFKTRLIERRTRQPGAVIRNDLMIDNPSIRASQGMGAAKEFLNASKRERIIDGSLNEVTVRRFFGGADWSGQLTGFPTFHTAKSVDIVVAGTNLVVLSHAGAKLWEAKLAYEIADRFKGVGDDDDESSPAPNSSPVLEVGSRLLVADMGTIHCFDAKTGAVQWRLNTVGAKQMVPDGLGNVYIATTTASPDSIKFEGESDLYNKDRPEILKVELGTGKELWATADLGENVYVSGKFVYGTRGRISSVALMHADYNLTDPVVNYRIHRLDARDGSEKWEYHRTRAPQSIEVDGTRLLITYRDQIQMLKYTSF